MARLPRLSTARNNWRACLYGFIYYLCAVIILENILALVYLNRYTEIRIPEEGLNRDERRTLEFNWSHMAAHPMEKSDKVIVEPVPAQKTVPMNRTSSSTTSRTSSTSTRSPSSAILTTRKPTLEEMERNFYRMHETKINPYLYDFVLRPQAMCENETFMVILVHSHHPNVDRRAAIRSTWGSVTRNGSWPHLPHLVERMKLVFVFGTHKDPGLNDRIREEWQTYDDVVQGNFFDSYQNMTLKSLLGLKLVFEHCPGAKYLFKNDDDMFINVPYLVSVLRNRTYNRAIMGPLNIGSKVYRNGKWKVSRVDFPFDFYPPYESGAAYLITCDIVRELYETAEYVPSIFIDDVYITGILGKILNVTHEKQQGFAYWTNKPPKACDIIENRIISGTKMTPALLTSTWREINIGPVCASTQSKNSTNLGTQDEGKQSSKKQ